MNIKTCYFKLSSFMKLFQVGYCYCILMYFRCLEAFTYVLDMNDFLICDSDNIKKMFHLDSDLSA